MAVYTLPHYLPFNLPLRASCFATHFSNAFNNNTMGTHDSKMRMSINLKSIIKIRKPFYYSWLKVVCTPQIVG